MHGTCSLTPSVFPYMTFHKMLFRWTVDVKKKNKNKLQATAALLLSCTNEPCDQLLSSFYWSGSMLAFLLLRRTVHAAIFRRLWVGCEQEHHNSQTVLKHTTSGHTYSTIDNQCSDGAVQEAVNFLKMYNDLDRGGVWLCVCVYTCTSYIVRTWDF